MLLFFKLLSNQKLVIKNISFGSTQKQYIMKIASTTKLSLLSLIILTAINCINYSTNDPRFLATDKFQSGSALVFSGGASSLTSPAPSHDFVFANSFPSIPALAYGIQQYKGNDTFFSEGYFLNQQGTLTATGFTVTIQILQMTTVMRLSVAYIAIDPTFPYHINSFDNVPLNLTSGPFTNISQNTTSDRTFTEVVNYTTLCGARTFNRFTDPIGDHRILLFLTTIQIRARDNGFQTGYFVSEQILSNEQYSVSVTAKNRTVILKMHFSMITLNIVSVQQSEVFEIIFTKWQLTQSGGSYSFPEIFVPNFMLGLLSFIAPARQCGIYYNWYYRNSGTSSFDVYVQPSVILGGGSSTCALMVQVSNIFYLRHWTCDPPYIYFNYTSQLCQIECWDYFTEQSSNNTCKKCNYNCFKCLQTDIDSCTQCNSLMDHRALNSATNNCQCENGYYEPIVQNKVCPSCSSAIANCKLCFVDAGTTVTCTECYPGHLLFTSNNTCIACINMNCLDCSQTSNECFDCMMYHTENSTSTTSPCAPCAIKCGHCDISDTLTCTGCNPSDNRQLIGGSCQCKAGFYQTLTTNVICQPCTLQISDCAICFANFSSSQVQCTKCMNGFSLAPNNTCVTCSSIDHCISCNPNAFQCNGCDVSAGYFLNLNTKACELCMLSNCLECLSRTYCKTCDAANFYVVDTSSGNCQQCPVLCNCDGYTLPKINGVCSVLCGDSLIRNSQTCDDGNTQANDGCSSQCQIEQHWQCVNQPSCCTINFSQPLTLKTMNIHKVPYQNRINVTFSVTPSLNFLFLNDSQKEDLIQIRSSQFWGDISQLIQGNRIFSVDLKKFVSSNQVGNYEFSNELQEQIKSIETFLIMSSFVYKMDIQDQNLTFQLKLLLSSNVCSSSIQSSIVVQIKPQNNIPAVFLPQEENQKLKVAQTVGVIIQSYSYLIMAISSVANAKIVGLELFGVLQLAFFSIGSHNYVNYYLSSFMTMKHLNGYNPALSELQTGEMPKRVTAIKYDSEFVNNCNVMLILMIGNFLIGGTIFLVGKSLKRRLICSIGKFSLTEINVSFVYFNAFNISYSLGLHYAYGDQTSNLFVLSSISVLISIIWIALSMLHLLLSKSELYGEFKQKFKSNFESQIYCFVSLLFRVIIGAYTAMMNEFQISTLVILSVAIFYIIFCLASLPFKQAIHNYRAIFCHLVEIYILFTVNYYRSLLINLPIVEVQKRILPAAIQIYLILAVILVSTLCLIYQVYFFIKKLRKLCSRSKVSDCVDTNQIYKDKDRVKTQESIIDQADFIKQKYFKPNVANSDNSDILFKYNTQEQQFQSKFSTDLPIV